MTLIFSLEFQEDGEKRKGGNEFVSQMMETELTVDSKMASSKLSLFKDTAPITSAEAARYDIAQCLSRDLKTGCLKLAVVKFLGVQIFKGDHNILIFQP